jgi:Flp pilus assembly pilin Flp
MGPDIGLPALQMPLETADNLKKMPLSTDRRGRELNGEMFTGLSRLAAWIAVRSRSEDGQTLTEYGMLLSVIVIVVLLAAVFLGQKIEALYTSIINAF